jgi:hypothetical protein
MSDDLMFERNTRAWLELGPTQAPDHAIENALLTIASTRQERDLRIPRRVPRVAFPARLATAAAIAVLAVGGGFLLLQGPLAQVGHPSPAPSSSPSPAPDYSGLKGRIVFGSFGAPTGPQPVATNIESQIWLVRADGTGLHELAPGNPPGPKTSFDISPDGQIVAFTTGGAQGTGSCGLAPCPDARIWQVRMDGSGDPTLLSKDCGGTGSGPRATCNESDPAFSPDGTKVAFVRWEASIDGATETNVVGFRDLTTGTVVLLICSAVGRCLGGGSYPTWTPDGKHILYWTHGSWALMDPDGTNASLINPAGLTFPNLPKYGSFARLQPTH